MQGQTRTRNPDANRNVIPLAIWTLAWVVTLGLASSGPNFLWDSQPVASWIAIGANLVVGAVWIVVQARYLRGLDELQRKIMLDATAVALGVGFVGGFACAAATSGGLIAFDADIALFSVLIAVTYVLAIIVGSMRYR